MSRELKQTISGAVGVAGRSAAEVAVKTGRAEVEAATKRLAEARASLVEANSRASAGGLDREAVREALFAEQLEQRLVENAEAALEKSKAELAERAAEADRVARQATYDRTCKALDDAEAVFREKYAPNSMALIDAMSIAAVAEKAVAEANALLPAGAEPLTLPFNFGGATPKFARLVLSDARGREIWTGDQFTRPTA